MKKREKEANFTKLWICSLMRRTAVREFGVEVGEMEPKAQKSLERVISQMSNSASCKVWVLGFVCGVCITYLFLAALAAPFKITELGMAYPNSRRALPHNPVISHPGGVTRSGSGTLKSVKKIAELSDDDRVLKLYAAWTAKLNGESRNESSASGLDGLDVPHAPHIEDCRLNAKINRQFDTRGEDGNLPPWTLWSGLLGLKLLQPTLLKDTVNDRFIQEAKLEGAYPPWVRGSDADNYPLTRQVQKDLWIHQHPPNCRDPELRFLVADWERFPGYGIGAQLAAVAGLLAIAVNEKRVLVTNYYNRADHSGCQGSSRSRWSCYFLPETSSECQKRAFDLIKNTEALENGTITSRDNYTSKEIWAGRVPRAWGRPWTMLQPTTEIDGTLLMSHRKMDMRWWRAQAIRYLMRFQSAYTCHLLNVARHEAFGIEAAKMVVDSNLPLPPQKAPDGGSEVDLGHFVWSDRRPWVPRPLLSMHVRMGDKACEMKVVGFESYMQLGNRVRERFRNLNRMWLSTEMQEVIDQTRSYPHWKFYYTNVARQVGNTTMADYESSLGRETSTNYPLVNFLMATEADFFIGALGSTWCYLIDGMRNTGGKVMSGYLSVNKDRFW